MHKCCGAGTASLPGRRTGCGDGLVKFPKERDNERSTGKNSPSSGPVTSATPLDPAKVVQRPEYVVSGVQGQRSSCCGYDFVHVPFLFERLVRFPPVTDDDPLRTNILFIFYQGHDKFLGLPLSSIEQPYSP